MLGSGCCIRLSRTLRSNDRLATLPSDQEPSARRWPVPTSPAHIRYSSLTGLKINVGRNPEFERDTVLGIKWHVIKPQWPNYRLVPNPYPTAADVENLDRPVQATARARVPPQSNVQIPGCCVANFVVHKTRMRWHVKTRSICARSPLSSAARAPREAVCSQMEGASS